MVAMNHYQPIVRIIRYLEEHSPEQPNLATLAEIAGLSQFHLHRFFSAWAGITPMDFLQCLALAHARELLRRGERVLDSAQVAGLSGPGRLHDLCVTLEAASPGDVKSGGAGWTITAGFAASPFGRVLLGESPRGISHLSFVESADGVAELAELQAALPQAHLRRDDSAAARLVARIFAPPDLVHSQPALRALVRGTPFQVLVWRALLQVRPGTLSSYGRLATAVGKPGGARAVGRAVGQNPLGYLIPCHRVIRETGALGGYHWGRERKLALLVWESAWAGRCAPGAIK